MAVAEVGADIPQAVVAVVDVQQVAVAEVDVRQVAVAVLMSAGAVLMSAGEVLLVWEVGRLESLRRLGISVRRCSAVRRQELVVRRS